MEKIKKALELAKLANVPVTLTAEQAAELIAYIDRLCDLLEQAQDIMMEK